VQQQDLVTLTIDGREVSVPPGTSVLHAAEQLGIEIPTFCYSKKMAPLGACRMCLVAIERVKGFPPACATPVAPGMVVRTVSPDVVQTQQGILEFLLINHPLDCPICDKGGECPLQNLTFKYGPGKSRYREEKRHFVKPIPIGPQIMLDRERCIVCQLCVRFMEDVADDPQIVLLSRGGKTEVNVFPGKPFDSPFAGNTMELCPVGALTSRKYRFKARPWDLEHAPSICPTCALGCNVTLDVRRNALLRLMSRENPSVDDGWLCDRGRFGTLDRLQQGDRITRPLVRKQGQLVEASWEDALRVAAEGLSRPRGSGVAALASVRVTNEELYLLGRVFRTLLKSPHVAAHGASPNSTAALGGGRIADLDTADAIVLIGADPIARQPVLDLRIKKQVRRRSVPLVILADEPTGLDYLSRAKAPLKAQDATQTLKRLIARLEAAPSETGQTGTHEQPALPERLARAVVESVQGLAANVTIAIDPLEDVVAILRSAKTAVVLYDERILNPDTAAGSPNEPTHAANALILPNEQRVSGGAGVSPALVSPNEPTHAASAPVLPNEPTVSGGAGVSPALVSPNEPTHASPAPVLQNEPTVSGGAGVSPALASPNEPTHAANAPVLPNEPTRTASATDLLTALHLLAARVAPDVPGGREPLALAAEANSRGAIEMGAHRHWLPGGIPAPNAAVQANLQKTWGIQPIANSDKDVAQILADVRDGAIQALFLLDLDPIGAGISEALHLLERKAFIVAQASRTSGATMLADVVLPSAAYGEAAGTLTNTEGRVQRLHAALTPPEGVREGWKVLRDLGRALKGELVYVTVEDVTQEIALLSGLESWAGVRRQHVEPVVAGEVR